MNLVWLLFSFNGRINRVQFWLGTIGAGVGGLVLFFLLGVLFTPTASKDPAQVISSFLFALMPVWLLLCWAGLALQVKRFHDRGRSGLWTMLPLLPAMMVISSLVTAVAALIPASQSLASMEAVMVGAMASAGIWVVILNLVHLFMFVDLGCMPGRAEANKYGNPPPGGLGGGPSPVGGAPIPGQPSRATTQSIPGVTASTLTGAESAIDRAIAQSKQRPAAPAPAMAPRPAMATAQPSGGLRPATPGSFGRRPTR